MFGVSTTARFEVDDEKGLAPGRSIAGSFFLKTTYAARIATLEVALIWKTSGLTIDYKEKIEQFLIASEVEIVPGRSQQWAFKFRAPLKFHSYSGPRFTGKYLLVATIVFAPALPEGGSTPVAQVRKHLRWEQSIHVNPPRSTFIAEERSFAARGVQPWWGISALAWLAASFWAGPVVSLGGLGILLGSTYLSMDRLQSFQETAFRVVPGKDNGLRIRLHTLPDGNILTGNIYYRVRAIKKDTYHREFPSQDLLLEIGGAIQSFGRPTDDGFEVTLPWPRCPLPPPAALGGIGYHWELVLESNSLRSLVREVFPVKVDWLKE